MQYVIVLKQSADIELLRELVGDNGKVGKPRAAGRLVIVDTEPEIIVQVASRVPHVSIDVDQPVDMETFIDPAPQGWALPWISNSDGTYEINETGKGVDIYIVDTGIRTDHEDFEGRASMLWSYDGKDYDPQDAQSPWHGTSVASCAGGIHYGTAKGATLLGVRIDWYLSGIIKAVDKIIEHHLSKPDNRPSIVNFSGSSPRSTLGDIFNELVDYGITVVAAAGNEYEPQPRYPARHGWIKAVGALNEDGTRSAFSNLEAEVYAPGRYILAATIDSQTRAHITSGTSFAAPYYAGLMACALEGSDKFNTRSQVSSFMFAHRTQTTDRRRVDPFPNGPFQVRTVSTRVFGGTWYENASLSFSDDEIEAFVTDNLGDPQLIADVAREHNVSLNRLAKVTGYFPEQVDDWFSSHGVVPWWRH